MLALIADLQRYGGETTEELRRDLAAANQAINRARTDVNRVRLAVLLTLPGAAMAVNEDGEVAGSVSGGCVEGAVLTEALEVLQSGGTPRLCTFGYSDDEAFAVGLTCGGIIDIFVEPISRETFPERSRLAPPPPS